MRKVYSTCARKSGDNKKSAEHCGYNTGDARYTEASLAGRPLVFSAILNLGERAPTDRYDLPVVSGRRIACAFKLPAHPTTAGRLFPRCLPAHAGIGSRNCLGLRGLLRFALGADARLRIRSLIIRLLSGPCFCARGPIRGKRQV